MSHDNLQEDKDNKNHVMTGEFVLFYNYVQAKNDLTFYSIQKGY